MSLIPQSLKSVVSNLDTQKMSQQIAMGGQAWLPEGLHKVVVSEVDLSELRDKGVIYVHYEAGGAKHRDRMQLTVTNSKTKQAELNWRFRDVLGALIPSIEAYDAFFAELVADNASVFAMLTDMSCNITIARGVGNKYGPGERTPNGSYIVRDTQTSEIVGGPAGSIEEAVGQAEIKGYTKSYLNITKVQANEHAEENLAMFTSRMAEFHKPKPKPPVPAAFPKFPRG